MNMTDQDRNDYYSRLTSRKLAPLWEVLKGLLPPEPASKAIAFQWKYDELRPLLIESGTLVSVEEAERRVLVLENPSFVGQSRVTSTLYAGIQLILPGEMAPAHRHSASALRFMLEGAGAITTVGEEQTTMQFGDFVITPAWGFHSHRNAGSAPCVWLDGLDLPMVSFFESMFSENREDSAEILEHPEGESLARFGQTLLPIEKDSRYGATTPLINYPYDRTRRALLNIAKGSDPDRHWGITLRYANPLDGGWAIPTMATWMTYVPMGFRTSPIRSTDCMVMAVAEGEGEAIVGGKRFSFGPRDIHALPGWCWRSFEAASDCFLFFFSDRGPQEKLGWFREERSCA